METTSGIKTLVSVGGYSHTHTHTHAHTHTLDSAFSAIQCHVDYLQSSIKEFAASADQLWAELQKASSDPSDLNHLRMVNYQLMQLERAFIVPEGLPGRPYYK